MSREEAIKVIRKMLACTDLTDRANLTADMVSACNLAIKALEQEPIYDELRAEITTLQNRCYALTKGVMCRFCKYECEYKAETEKT